MWGLWGVRGVWGLWAGGVGGLAVGLGEEEEEEEEGGEVGVVIEWRCLVGLGAVGGGAGLGETGGGIFFVSTGLPGVPGPGRGTLLEDDCLLI